MNKDITDILSHQGLGLLKFGMTKAQVEQIIGAPNETEIESSPDEEEEDKIESWHYDELEISVSFQESFDWRMVMLVVSSEDYLFRGEEIIGLDRETLLQKLEQLGLKNLELEDWSSEDVPDYKLIASDDLEMSFWLDEGEVSEIQWGPLFIDEETVQWPE